jgi:hypothetical protein
MYLAREKSLADADFYRWDYPFVNSVGECKFMTDILICCLWNKKWSICCVYVSSVTREAEANRLKLTPEFLELKFIESIANNTKIFFGDKVFLSS